MELPGRRGAARGPRTMGAPGGEAAAAAAGPARFRCPEDFCARRFAPTLSLEGLRAAGKRLLLIRAPADFRPESLSGQSLPLLGARLVRAARPDGGPRVYSLQAGPEESASRLLLPPAAQPDRLACARPFSGSLSIRERCGDPGAPRALFPVAERPPPRVPGGLKQRFFPFGARLQGQPPPSEAAGKSARKRSKRRPLLPTKQEPWQPEGPGQLPGGTAEPAGGPPAPSAGHKQRLLKEEEAAAAATDPSVLPVRLLDGQGASLEEGSLPGEAGRRRARRKEKKKRKARLEAGELPPPSSGGWRPEPEGGGGHCAGDPPADRGRPRETTATQEAGVGGPWSAAAVKEEPVDDPRLEGPPEEGLGAAGKGPAGEPPGHKRKKRRSRERGAGELWGQGAAVKEEPVDVPCLGGLPEEGLGSPGRERPGCTQQSPGRGAEGLWAVAAVREELGAAPRLGTPVEGSRWAAPEEPPGCRKKKSREERRGGGAAAEGLRGIGPLGAPPEESWGPAGGELLACQKRKRKRKRGRLDEEPLPEGATETPPVEPPVPDWGVPLCLGEPPQANRAAPRPKRKKRRRGEGEGQAGHSAAET